MEAEGPEVLATLMDIAVSFAQRSKGEDVKEEDLDALAARAEARQ